MSEIHPETTATAYNRADLGWAIVPMGGVEPEWDEAVRNASIDRTLSTLSELQTPDALLDAEKRAADHAGLADTVLNIASAGGYWDRPGDLLKTLGYFSAIEQNVEYFAGSFVNRLLTRLPLLQVWLVDAYRQGGTDPTIEQIVTSKLFVWKVQTDAFSAKAKQASSVPAADYEQARMEQAFELERHIMDRCEFNSKDQEDLRAAWTAQRRHIQSKRKPGEHGVEEALAYERDSFIALVSLYRQDPDAPKKLYDRFGIRNFARYYDMATDMSALTPQIASDFVFQGDAVLSRADDEKGTFSGRTVVGNAEGIKMSDPTFFEARRPLEGLMHLLRATEQDGAVPIERLLVVEHGNMLMVGGLDMWELNRFNGINRLKNGRLFADNAEIVLGVCGSGRRFGIAQRLNKLTGISVASSPNSTGGVAYRDGEYVFRDKRGPVKTRYYPGKKQKPPVSQ